MVLLLALCLAAASCAREGSTSTIQGELERLRQRVEELEAEVGQLKAAKENMAAARHLDYTMCDTIYLPTMVAGIAPYEVRGWGVDELIRQVARILAERVWERRGFLLPENEMVSGMETMSLAQRGAMVYVRLKYGHPVKLPQRLAPGEAATEGDKLMVGEVETTDFFVVINRASEEMLVYVWNPQRFFYAEYFLGPPDSSLGEMIEHAVPQKITQWIGQP